jgi:hypothetical protein
MAPKKAAKDKGKDDGVAFKTLYVKREAQPPPEPPAVVEVETAWRACRNHFALPLPLWDKDAVDVLEWKPSEVENLYASTTFFAKALPKNLTKDIIAWRRAANVTDATAGDEPEPQGCALSDEKEEEVVEDPKAKAKPKADPKAKAKAKGGPDPGDEKKTTVQQFAEVELDTSHSNVVTVPEFRSREVNLVCDEATSPLCQMIAAQFATIGEHRKFMTRGSFLWELIYPQGADGMPLFNPHGKYVVKLFVHGCWRMVMVDDVVPVGIAASGSGSVHAPIMPASSLPGVIWPALLTKALLTAFAPALQDKVLPIITALTGWAPMQLAVSADSLRTSINSRLLVVFQKNSEVDSEAKQRDQANQPHEEREARGKKNKAAPAPEMPTLNLASNAAPAPKLGAQASDALIQFLVCEAVDDPPQVRLKASMWRPLGGTSRRIFLSKDFDSDEDDDDGLDEEEVGLGLPHRVDEGAAGSDNDEPEEDEDEVERGGGAAATSGPVAESGAPGTSARSKDEGDPGSSAAGEGSSEAAAKATAEGAATADAPGAPEEDEDVPLESPWPLMPPAPIQTRSTMMDHQAALVGGFWINEESLQGACDSYFVYLPPGPRLLSECLDTTWPSDRSAPFTPPAMHIMKLKLVSEDFDDEVEEGEKPLSAPCHRGVVMYTPQRPHPVFGKDVPAGLGGANLSCILQRVSHWIPAKPTSPAVGRRGLQGNGVEPPAIEDCPDSIGLSVGDGRDGAASWTDSVRSVLLPPGEHWYLVQDDAVRAGSVLSVFVDGCNLNVPESKVEFVEISTVLSELGTGLVSVEQTEYPPQLGFSIWAKTEVVIAPEVLPDVSQLLLVSQVSDPSLRPFLRVRFLRVAMEADGEMAQRCSRWNIVELASVPLSLVTSLTFGMGRDDVSPIPEGWAAKYVVMLEANVPEPAKAGTFALKLLLPPWEVSSHASPPPAPSTDPDAPDEEAEKPPGVIQLKDLKSNHVMRWTGETEPNGKLLVLRERLTVPMGEGDVAASLRVTVTGLPNAFLRATLIAQLLPEQEMRPKPEEGVELEPLALGAPVDPKEYNGRFNWLSCCKPVSTECGLGVVVMPHVVLCEGSTYRLDVCVDPFRGPDSLDGGHWLLEMHGPSEIEVGADTQEQDLEALVYKSFEDQDADTLPLRKDKAAKSRLNWRRQRNLVPEPTEEELAKEAEAAAAAAAPDPKAAKGGKGPAGAPDLAAQAEELKAKEEAERKTLEAALERAAAQPHVNKNVSSFLHLHTDEPPVLVECDPWTVVPDAQSDLIDPADSTERALVIARSALGAVGLEEVRLQKEKETEDKWEAVRSQMAEAKDTNKTLLTHLSEWRDEHTAFEMKFLEPRSELTDSLRSRFDKRLALRKEVTDPERADPGTIRAALDEAVETGVATWDAELIERAEQKLSFLESVPLVQAALAKVADEATPVEELEAARVDLGAKAETFRDSARKLLKAKVPLPPEVPFRDIISQTEAVLAKPETVEAEAAES